MRLLPGHYQARLPRGYYKAYYESYYQATTRLPRGYYVATTRLLPDHYQATTRLLRGYHEATTRSRTHATRPAAQQRQHRSSAGLSYLLTRWPVISKPTVLHIRLRLRVHSSSFALHSQKKRELTFPLAYGPCCNSSVR